VPHINKIQMVITCCLPFIFPESIWIPMRKYNVV